MLGVWQTVLRALLARSDHPPFAAPTALEVFIWKRACLFSENGLRKLLRFSVVVLFYEWL